MLICTATILFFTLVECCMLWYIQHQIAIALSLRYTILIVISVEDFQLENKVIYKPHQIGSNYAGRESGSACWIKTMPSKPQKLKYRSIYMVSNLKMREHFMECIKNKEMKSVISITDSETLDGCCTDSLWLPSTRGWRGSDGFVLVLPNLSHWLRTDTECM